MGLLKPIVSKMPANDQHSGLPWSCWLCLHGFRPDCWIICCRVRYQVEETRECMVVLDRRFGLGSPGRVWQGLLGMAMLLISSDPSFSEDGTLFTLDKNGALHFRDGTKELKVEPAFEDYTYMMFDVCDAMGMTIGSGECAIDPLNGNVAAGALAYEDSKGKYLIYNRNLSPKVGYEGAISIIAHEIGHHYCRHLHKLPSPKQELEADRFSGAAMRRMNFSKQDALSAAPLLDKRPSKSHPGRDERVKWILMGWNKPESAFNCR